jgi:tRNA G18 (ribose-2'-O)-methylase SpoU
VVIPEEVHDPDDPRLVAYGALRDLSARNRLEADLGVFVVEGATALAQVVPSGHALLSGLVLPTRVERVLPTWPAGVPLFVAAPAVFDALAGFPVHRGVLAVARRRPPSSIEELAAHRTLVALEDLNDHENVGAIGRTARALGATGLVRSPRCADPYARRSVRVSQGHLLHLRSATDTAWPDGLAALAAAGHRVLALTPGPGSVALEEVTIGADEPVTVVAGSEGPGLTPSARAMAHTAVRIPMVDGVDSLNVAHAIAVALHHLAATRRRALRNRYEAGPWSSHRPGTMPAC